MLLSLIALLLVSPTSADGFDAARAWGHLNTQVAFGTRDPGSERHRRCRDWLLGQTTQYCDNPRQVAFTHSWSQTNKPIEMWNIVGEQNWKDAKVRVMLIAHWDTRPTADMELSATARRKPILGANDGASGVSVLLELMRVFRETPPEVGIQYVLVDGEDLGPGLDEMFLGASHHAKTLKEPKADYGILLDMIGDKDLVVPMEPNSMRYARRVVDALYGHAAKIGLEKTFPKEVGPTIEDDHLPLNRAGIPTVDLIDFDYPAWHTLADTPDMCSAESLGKVGQLLESFLRKKPAFRP